MKRSEINEAIDYVMEQVKIFKFPLPPFAYYTPYDWKQLKEDERELVDTMLGWDITDFGTGDFMKTGLSVFVFRNGSFYDKKKYPKSYCEKLLFVRDGQILPYHFHWNKMEDIIHRGGGDLEITLWQSDESQKFTSLDVCVSVDGKKVTLPAGGKIVLKPGESITLMPYQYHMWQGVPGSGDVVLFEVSTSNDDHVDNCFHEAQDRIPMIEEDEKTKHLIFADYDNYVSYYK